jgi:hypothetical protein
MSLDGKFGGYLRSAISARQKLRRNCGGETCS